MTWYKDLLRRRNSAIEETQSVADAAAATYLQSEAIVVNLQADQAKLNNINKRRFSVERELTKAEMIIDDLRIMINGTKQQEERIKSVADLLTSTFDDLMHVGEPPYHRPNRKIEDQLCMTVLTAFQESLIDASFVDSAGKVITAFRVGLMPTCRRQYRRRLMPLRTISCIRTIRRQSTTMTRIWESDCSTDKPFTNSRIFQ